MTLFDIAAILLCLSAVFGYVNHRYLRLPPTIGLMVIAMASSLSVVVVNGENHWLGQFKPGDKHCVPDKAQRQTPAV